MTDRDRMMMLILIPVGISVVLFGGFLFVMNLWDGLKADESRNARLKQEVFNNETQLMVMGKARRTLKHWQAISLPPNVGMADARYRTFLRELAEQHKLTIESFGASRGSLGGGVQTASQRSLDFKLKASGTLEQWIGFYKDFYAINLPNQISQGTVTVQGSGPNLKLVMDLTISALSFPGIPNRDFLPAIPDHELIVLEMVAGLTGAPTGIALTPWSISPTGWHGRNKLAGEVQDDRDYSRLLKKNIFAGLAERPTAPVAAAPKADEDILKFVKLTSIQANSSRREAWFYNQRTGDHTRVRAVAGDSKFSFRDRNKLVILRGEVKRIDRRDVVFEANEKFYTIHVGESLDQAMENELSEEQRRAVVSEAGIASGGP